MKKRDFLFLLLILSLFFSCSDNIKIISSSYFSNNDFSSETNSSFKSEIANSILEIDFSNTQSAVDLNENATRFNYVKNLFGEYLENMTCTKIYEDMGAIKIASGSSDGIWRLIFNKRIACVTLELKNYTKYIQYNDTYQIDVPSFFINDNKIDMEIENNGDSVFKMYQYTFASDVSFLELESKALGNQKGRTILKSMKIEFC